MAIDLSVLICSVHTRYSTFGLNIQRQIWDQYAQLAPSQQDRVEIIMVTDNKKMMLGQKRNIMVDMAQGKYVAFVDDDDRLEPDYLATLLEYAGSTDADVITFLVSVSMNSGPPRICRYSIDYETDRNTEEGYERLPNHICAVRRDLAVKVSFPNRVYGEDAAFSKLLKPLLHSQLNIERVLYHYDYSLNTTETQQHLRGKMRRRLAQPPVVDVVIMSKAATPELTISTQEAVNSCLAGANSLPVNVIVMEQQPGIRYDHARTIYAGGDFNYNRNANTGIRLGFAQWVMVANNDLIFDDGWLHSLLAAGHPFVSPKSVVDRRQDHVITNEVGDRTGVHLSGWCFMMTRQLWHEIGGLDEDVAFWCSDDAVIEQTRAVGVLPMLVPDSHVLHLESQTLKLVENMDDLTWRQLDIFIKKYGYHRLQTKPEFLRWRAHNSSTMLSN